MCQVAYTHNLHLDQDIGHFHHLEVPFVSFPVNT